MITRRELVCVALLCLLPLSCFTANTGDSSDAFYQLFNKMQNLLQGGLGVSLSLSSFVLGVFGSAFSHRLMPATAGAGIADWIYPHVKSDNSGPMVHET